MTYEEYCEDYRRVPSDEGRKIYNEIRQTVASEIAMLFGFATGTEEEKRFLNAVEKAARGE